MKQENQTRHITRRGFLKQAGCAALGSTGALSTIFNLHMANVASAQSALDDYKAIVCVFLGGGNDAYNTLIPTEASEYANYQAVRGNVALSMSGADAVRPLNAVETDGRSFAVHPSLPNVQSLFDSGNVAFVANVGTLVEPTTVAQYQNKSVQLPRSLFSHNDQVMQWQTVVPQSVSPSGWAGRMADVLASSDPQNISMNISLAGNTIMQTGDTTSHYSISENGAIALWTKDWGGYGTDIYNLVAGATDDDETSLVGQAYQNLFHQTYINNFKNSVDKERFFTERYETAGQANDLSMFDDAINLRPYDDDHNAVINDLRAVAQTIAARESLGMNRQIFFVTVPNWDHHDELINTHHEMLQYIDNGLKAFWDALGGMGLQDNVLTFTASDFGRTLRTNGRGTDHAWGGHQLVMGGSVLRGQQVHGHYPTGGEFGLAEGLDVDRNGRLLPTTSVDEFMSEMALWFGVPYNELETVFPNIRNFYSSTADYLPIGYLEEALMPETALPGSVVPLAVSLREAEARAQSERLHTTKSGLIAGTGLAATAAMVALRSRKNVS